MNTNNSGVILQLQDYSIHDGKGIRTTIFLTGCGLRCQWCANPETWTSASKLAFYKHKCAECSLCIEACPEKINPISDSFTQSLCTFCGNCVAICKDNALQIACTPSSVKDLMTKIKRDELFFRYSGGGVTFSGGEPFMQHDFLRSLISECEAMGISTWVETCGYFNWEHCKDLIPKMEHIFIDIKHMDPKTHKKYTGKGNELILQNVKNIYELNVPITIRIPLIVEVNLDEKNLRSTAKFIQKELSGCSIELLPYHDLGKAKYHAFRMQNKYKAFTSPSSSQITKAYRIFDEYGVGKAQ